MFLSSSHTSRVYKIILWISNAFLIVVAIAASVLYAHITRTDQVQARESDCITTMESMKSISFPEYIRGYNFQDDYNRINQLCQQLADTDSGTLSYKNFRDVDCLWYYSSFGDGSDLDILGMIADSLDVDLRWLYGENAPMENTQENDTALQYVFYNNNCSEYLLDSLDDVYIAMMTQCAALIPRFYVLVNRSTNEMHILPLFLKEDSSQFYECPSDFSTLTGTPFSQEILKQSTWY